MLFDALLSAALGNIRQGNFKEGISDLQEGMKLNPESTKAQEEMGNARQGMSSRGGERACHRGEMQENCVGAQEERHGDHPSEEGPELYIPSIRD